MAERADVEPEPEPEPDGEPYQVVLVRASHRERVAEFASALEAIDDE